MRILGGFCVFYAVAFVCMGFACLEDSSMDAPPPFTCFLMVLFFIWLAYLCFKNAAKRESLDYIKKKEEIRVTKAIAEEKIKQAKMETENYRNLLKKEIEMEMRKKETQGEIALRLAFEQERQRKRDEELLINREVLKARGIPSCPKCGSTHITTVFENGASKNVCSFCGFKYFPSQYI